MEIGGDKAWEQMQKKVFARWVNTHLKKRGLTMEVANMEHEFNDGIKLINLYEVISDTPLGKYNPAPKMRIHKLANLNLPLKEINKFVKSVGIKLEFSAEEICDSVTRSILGMIWCLIHKFEIQDISEEEMSAREGLLLWCQKNTQGYKDVSVQNFNYSWQDGLAFCALINKFHPELMDFDSLSKNNALDNLRLAFQVAEDKLDIPMLLDPEDMVNMKPDDKAVMTYVARYWKKFATGQKTKTAANRVAKMIERRKANEQMAHDYANRAAELAKWTKEKTQQYDNDDFGNCLAAVQEKSRAFNGYKSTEKPPKSAEKLDLEALLANLKSKQKAENSPVYEPPQDIAPSTLQSLWDNLGNTELAYDSGLREALLRQKRLEILLLRFRAKVRKLNAWAEEREQYLRTEPNVDSISTAQARIKIHEAHEDEYAAVQSSFQAARDIGQEILDAKHAASDEVSASLQKLDETTTTLSSLSTVLKEKLESELQRLQQLEDKCLQFAKLSEKFNLWVEDAQLLLTDPVSASSVAEVEDREANVQSLKEEYNQREAVVAELEQLSTEIHSQGLAQNPFARFTIDNVKEKYAELGNFISTRQTELASEKEIQQKHAELIETYSQKAKDVIEFVKASKAEVEQDVGGSLEEQLQILRSKIAEILEKGNNKYAALEEDYQLIINADIAENAPISLQELQTQLEQLSNILKKRTAFLEESIIAQKTGDVTAEQIKDFRETFNHFDRRKNGRLPKLDFKACIQSLGHELSDKEIADVLNQYDSNKDNEIEFDEFVKFMSTRVAETDSKHDVLSAFKTIANEKEFVTEGDIRKAMSKDQADYLLSIMPKCEGGYDYKSYVDQAFGQ